MLNGVWNILLVVYVHGVGECTGVWCIVCVYFGVVGGTCTHGVECVLCPWIVEIGCGIVHTYMQ